MESWKATNDNVDRIWEMIKVDWWILFYGPHCSVFGIQDGSRWHLDAITS